MIVRILVVLTWLGSLPGVVAVAAELIPAVGHDHLGARVRGLAFPGNLKKDLLSGLSNTILIRFDLMENSRVRSRRSGAITIKYDLWDETFKMDLKTEGSVKESRTLPSLEKTLLFLADLNFSRLWLLSELPSSGDLTLNADVLLNPVEREQMEKIKKWVTQNSVSVPIDPTGLGGSGPVGSPRSSTFFNKIFEQYATGTDVASAWRQTVASKLFRHDEVTHEK
ncbi:MAG: hypothetical protein AB7G93_05830 [Bdellovibrionales bacterium]